MGQRGSGVYASMARSPDGAFVVRRCSFVVGVRPMMRFLSLLGAIAVALSLAAQTKPQYEVYALRYATIPGFRVAGLVGGADKDRKGRIAMIVWRAFGD